MVFLLAQPKLNLKLPITYTYIVKLIIVNLAVNYRQKQIA